MIELAPMIAPNEPLEPDEPSQPNETEPGGKGGVAAQPVLQTGNQGIDGLLGGTSWAGLNLTYSFPTSAADYGTGQGPGADQYPDPAPFNAFAPLTGTQIADVQRAFALISSYTNLTFTEVAASSANNAVLRLANTSPTVAPSAYAYLPYSSPTAGDVFFGGTGQDPAMGNFDSGNAILHEIGHALGLKHGQDNETYGQVPANLLSNDYALMNYPAYIGASSLGGSTIAPGASPQTYMMYDIAALQYLYGANFSNVGQTLTYTWSPTTGEEFINGVSQGVPFNNHIFSTVWTAGATATYDFSNYGQSATLDLRPGMALDFSAAQLADLGYYSADGPGTHMALGNVYNALTYFNDTRSEVSGLVTGNGNNVVYGNDVYDTIRLGSGNDTLNAGGGGGLYYAGAGNDIFNGGAGDDTYNLYDAGGLDFIYGGGGHDAVVFDGAFASYTLAENGGLITVTGGDQGTDQLQGVQTLQFADRVINIPCFAAGTRLATPDGPVAVDALCVGDRVLTQSGHARPVRWIGRTRVDCRRHPRPASVLPVRIAAHAFGPELPSRDLLVSPDHALLVEDVLIPAKCLLDGDAVRQVGAAIITYFHVELDTHDVVLAEGLPAESYLDTGNRRAFADGAVAPLHPDPGACGPEGDLVWEAAACAPLVVTGEAVERARARLARRKRRAA